VLLESLNVASEERARRFFKTALIARNRVDEPVARHLRVPHAIRALAKPTCVVHQFA
jgi:hypothetical protein